MTPDYNNARDNQEQLYNAPDAKIPLRSTFDSPKRAASSTDQGAHKRAKFDTSITATGSSKFSSKRSSQSKIYTTASTAAATRSSRVPLSPIPNLCSPLREEFIQLEKDKIASASDQLSMKINSQSVNYGHYDCNQREQQEHHVQQVGSEDLGTGNDLLHSDPSNNVLISHSPMSIKTLAKDESGLEIGIKIGEISTVISAAGPGSGGTANLLNTNDVDENDENDDENNDDDVLEDEDDDDDEDDGVDVTVQVSDVGLRIPDTGEDDFKTASSGNSLEIPPASREATNHVANTESAKVRKYRSASCPNLRFHMESCDSVSKVVSKTHNHHHNSSNRLVKFKNLIQSQHTSHVTSFTNPWQPTVSSEFAHAHEGRHHRSSSKKLRFHKQPLGVSHSSLGTGKPSDVPPVNVNSLREIDLSQIVRNPQLRHDIIFDPQLQFRPNLDGDRGRRKRAISDEYWRAIEEEIEIFFNEETKFDPSKSKLPSLFRALREILISLLPSKEKRNVKNILDLDLISQQLVQKCVDFMFLAKWLSDIFKSHCAPMRDAWVDEMMAKFVEANDENSIAKLVESLRMVFAILEVMKLDIANHQIRILRPILIETAVGFERDYFQNLITKSALDISDAYSWFNKFRGRSDASRVGSNGSSMTTNRPVNSILAARGDLVDAVLSLLSCAEMVHQYPSTLAFDHSRLILLRSNIRQVVCLNLCVAAYQQIVRTHVQSQNLRLEKLSPKKLADLKKSIVAIITEDNGSVKWTKNIHLISSYITNEAVEPLQQSQALSFAHTWLLNNTLPSSRIYGLMEREVVKSIRSRVETEQYPVQLPPELRPNTAASTTSATPASSPYPPNSSSSKRGASGKEDAVGAIAAKLGVICSLHWQVFGDFYMRNAPGAANTSQQPEPKS